MRRHSADHFAERPWKLLSPYRDVWWNATRVHECFRRTPPWSPWIPRAVKGLYSLPCSASSSRAKHIQAKNIFRSSFRAFLHIKFHVTDSLWNIYISKCQLFVCRSTGSLLMLMKRGWMWDCAGHSPLTTVVTLSTCTKNGPWHVCPSQWVLFTERNGCNVSLMFSFFVKSQNSVR